MNSKEELTNSENINETNSSSKEELVNSENIHETQENYNIGWTRYCQITNGTFAMLGFIAIILIELFSEQSFLKWAGIL